MPATSPSDCSSTCACPISRLLRLFSVNSGCRFEILQVALFTFGGRSNHACACQQRLIGRCKRVQYCHAAPGEAVLHVFTEQHPAAVLGRYGEEEGGTYLH